MGYVSGLNQIFFHKNFQDFFKTLFINVFLKKWNFTEYLRNRDIIRNYKVKLEKTMPDTTSEYTDRNRNNANLSLEYRRFKGDDEFIKNERHFDPQKIRI